MFAIISNQIFRWIPLECDEAFELNRLIFIERKCRRIIDKNIVAFRPTKSEIRLFEAPLEERPRIDDAGALIRRREAFFAFASENVEYTQRVFFFGHLLIARVCDEIAKKAFIGKKIKQMTRKQIYIRFARRKFDKIGIFMRIFLPLLKRFAAPKYNARLMKSCEIRAVRRPFENVL